MVILFLLVHCMGLGTRIVGLSAQWCKQALTPIWMGLLQCICLTLHRVFLTCLSMRNYGLFYHHGAVVRLRIYSFLCIYNGGFLSSAITCKMWWAYMRNDSRV